MPEHGHGRDSQRQVSTAPTGTVHPAPLADMCFRWATEDPNPGGKKAEDARVAEEGRKVIASKLDDKLVEAAQSLRALEEGKEEDFYPILPDEPESEDEQQQQQQDDSRPVKRARGGDSTGLLGGDALENIKFYAELARKQAEEARTRKVPAAAAKASSGVALLGGYDSDSD